MEISIILVPVGAAVLRNIAGWLENALKDKHVSPYEWGELGATIFRVTVLGVGAGLGLGLEPMAAAGSGVVLDFIIKAIGKIKKQ